MTSTTLRKAALGFAVLTSCAGAVLGTSAPANAASTSVRSSEVTTAATVTPAVSFSLPTYGSNSTVPTWVFRNTLLCVFNAGPSTSPVLVQATIGGAYEWIYVPGFQQKCISRWWAGNPVRVTNRSYNPLYVNSN